MNRLNPGVRWCSVLMKLSATEGIWRTTSVIPFIIMGSPFHKLFGLTLGGRKASNPESDHGVL